MRSRRPAARCRKPISIEPSCSHFVFVLGRLRDLHAPGRPGRTPPRPSSTMRAAGLLVFDVGEPRAPPGVLLDRARVARPRRASRRRPASVRRDARRCVARVEHRCSWILLVAVPRPEGLPIASAAAGRLAMGAGAGGATCCPGGVSGARASPFYMLPVRPADLGNRARIRPPRSSVGTPPIAPAFVQLSAAAALAKRSTLGRGQPCRSA